LPVASRFPGYPELAGLTVLHLDKDFEVIADVTGQPLERLNIGTGSPAGS